MRTGKSKKTAVVTFAIVLTVALLAFRPHFWAWWSFPFLTDADIARAFTDEVAHQRDFEAVDAQETVVVVNVEQLETITPGPCLRWYSVADDEHRSARRGYLFAGGMAEFTCLVDITVADHDPMRAVMVTRRYTRWKLVEQPGASLMPGDHIDMVLGRLEARRRP